MKLGSLRIADLRVFAQVEIALEPDWNLFTGTNGAGKTSILEAAYLLSHGRSFRSGSRDALGRHGTDGYSIHAQVQRAGLSRGLGLARTKGRSEARIAGEAVPLGHLMQHAAVLCFEPGSHGLLSGAAEERRRFLDWGVFHVEPDFLATWLNYQRALRQRNALLRQAAGDRELEPWNHELARAGEPLSAMRARYFSRLSTHVAPLLERLLPELGAPQLTLSPGHEAARPLQDELRERLSRDRERGHSTRGPHRADWRLVFERAARHEYLSRGQEKLAAFALVMAQANAYAETHEGEMPVLCMDDLASEIDAEHLVRVLDEIDRSGAQILATATAPFESGTPRARPLAMFHVEQALVRRLL